MTTCKYDCFCLITDMPLLYKTYMTPCYNCVKKTKMIVITKYLTFRLSQLLHFELKFDVPV